MPKFGFLIPRQTRGTPELTCLLPVAVSKGNRMIGHLQSWPNPRIFLAWVMWAVVAGVSDMLIVHHFEEVKAGFEEHRSKKGVMTRSVLLQL